MIKHSHLERVILILETVSRSDTPPNANDLCDATNLPAATVYRLLRDLIDSGLLQLEPERRYSVGSRLKSIAAVDQSDRDIAMLATPLLRNAANENGAAFFLSRARGTGVEIIHVETPSDNKVSYLHPGLGFRPMHACSCAKVVAAYADQTLLRKNLAGNLRAYTEFTHTDARDVEAEFETIRQQGYAECVQEIELGICSVAAPVFQHDQTCTLSIGATGSLRRFSDVNRKQLGELLKVHAKELSSELVRQAG